MTSKTTKYMQKKGKKEEMEKNKKKQIYDTDFLIYVYVIKNSCFISEP